MMQKYSFILLLSLIASTSAMNNECSNEFQNTRPIIQSSFYYNLSISDLILDNGLIPTNITTRHKMPNETPKVETKPYEFNAVSHNPVANVIITEIMYNTTGTDDEWIEICNYSGSIQDLSNHSITVNGSEIYIFSNPTSIEDSQCITIALGDNGLTPFNPDCPFIPDYGNPSATNILPNSSRTIELIAPDSISIIDAVTYFSVNGGNGNGASLHLIDAFLDNSTTSLNWQEAQNGGTPGFFSLTSDCSIPELQLKNSSGTIQLCGAFSMDFGSQAIGYSTDKTFIIENDGNIALDIISITSSGDSYIVSPSAPFTVEPLSSQVVTIRFSPVSSGVNNSVLSIISNDSNNGQCNIDLTGTAFLPKPVINVEGDIGSFPDIRNGDTTPSGTDNTLFAAQAIGNSQTKSYIIGNQGTADLIISNISLSGPNAADFTLTLLPNNTIPEGSQSDFEITFTPQFAGIRNAIVTIINNDPDKSPFTFFIRGTGRCIATSNNFSPTSGPEGTIVTISGSNLIGATINFGTTILEPIFVTDTVLEVTIPNNGVTSNIKITDRDGCTNSRLFTVIRNKKSSCDGNTFLSELFISEITDATYGSLGYIEIYNPTASPIDLGDYSISIYPNGKTEYNDATHQPLTGTIASRDTFVVTTGTAGILGNTVCNIYGGNGSLGNLISTQLPGINKVDNKHDFIGLYKSTYLIDSFGIFGDNNWMDNLHSTISGDRGFNFRRSNSLTAIPESTFIDRSWEIIDWSGSGSSSCSDNNYSDIGTHDFSTGPLPSIIKQPEANSTVCDFPTIISIDGKEGIASGQPLAYQWYYIGASDLQWTEILPSDTDFSGQQSSSLVITDLLNFEGYQFYAQLRENTSTCFLASKAVRLHVEKTAWNGTTWSNGDPHSGSVAFLNNDYSTGNNGSFSSCQLIVSSGSSLIIESGQYVEVLNNVYVNGDSTTDFGYILVKTGGNFLQVNDLGTVSMLGTATIEVEKETAPLNNAYEYTYWSSPVDGAAIELALSQSSNERRFWFNASNYRDSYSETSNNNAVVLGQDDIDDDANDWTYAGRLVMEPGKGYAASHNPANFSGTGSPPFSFKFIFKGPFNNGLIEAPVYRNDTELADNNWNFIGNPYPSAIDVDAFFNANIATISGAIYLWSQGSPPSFSNNGNEASNFSQDDYAIVNGTGEVAGGDGVKPNRWIPSGQGFFVEYKNSGSVEYSSGNIKEGKVIFNNAMRSKAANSNSQFFRTRGEPRANKIWLNLGSDTGVFSQILVGYMDGATSGDDGFYYDAPKNKAVSPVASLYSISTDGTNKKFAIQGRNPSDLDKDEIIHLGLTTDVSVPTIYQFSIENLEGEFFNSEDIYLSDNFMGIDHNLKNEPYHFTSENGVFENRFQLKFQSAEKYSIDTNELTIVELDGSNIKFSVSDYRILQLVITDLLGRRLYNLTGNNAIEIYNLLNLSQGIFIAQAKLSNGQIITKRGLKSN